MMSLFIAQDACLKWQHKCKTCMAKSRAKVIYDVQLEFYDNVIQISILTMQLQIKS